MKELRRFSDGELLHGYLVEAAWFWFAASTEEKKLEAGLHRLMARCIYEELHRRGLDEPEADWVYGQARKAFPPDDLRPRNERGYRPLLGPSPNPGW